ncbi:hypothetical protein BD410DRAFT_789689 [Rickenella mellea]|uniref:Mitochondrial outer membrane transport complex Sam37/metaxin N-terminal domain-containing protein n=1 Tax=Rickenella mellea TaxID=50990 RepID=A0A4Y7Q2X8_9AGAM|nr:hypothetical protein BD410DRAFT_789689 [Rickenella mellea]
MTEVTLYVWPSPFLEPHSLAALLLLQLSIPGHFSIEETANPDTSPSGQLPYLRHGAVTVASFAAIAKYISRSKIAGHVDVDAHLDATQRAQCTAWSALVEAQLGDLVAYTFYAIADNYTNFTVPTLSAHMSIPQRYFVPGRLRELHRPRLEAVGLWDVSSFGGDGEGGDGDDEKGVRGVGVGGIAGGGVSGKGGGAKRKKNEGNMKMAFVREKVLETARRPLSLLSALLADRPFIFHDRATTLDILLAAHILLLTSPTLSSLSSQTNPQNLTLPCTPIHALISDSFPTLEAHARRVYDTCFPHGYAAAGLTKGKDEGRVGWNYDGEEGLSGDQDPSPPMA